MASEPFEATDDNGNTVTGTVEVFRHPKGPYFDSTHPYFRHPRYADAHFEYFDTRAACAGDILGAYRVTARCQSTPSRSSCLIRYSCPAPSGKSPAYLHHREN
jgi:hypothetical protein